MAFVESKYQTDEGTVVRIRVDQSTLDAAGQVVPSGVVADSALWAFASNPGSRRKKQLNARGLVLGRSVGIAPNAFVRKTFIPILTLTAWTDTEIGDAVTTGGQAYTVRAKIPQA